MKKLFVFVGDAGDGSYYTAYTMNEAWVAEQTRKYENDEFDYEYGPPLGCDGDGFHYDELTVPDECTLESLGVSDCADVDDEEE